MALATVSGLSFAKCNLHRFHWLGFRKGNTPQNPHITDKGVLAHVMWACFKNQVADSWLSQCLTLYAISGRRQHFHTLRIRCPIQSASIIDANDAVRSKSSKSVSSIREMGMVLF